MPKHNFIFFYIMCCSMKVIPKYLIASNVHTIFLMKRAKPIITKHRFEIGGV